MKNLKKSLILVGVIFFSFSANSQTTLEEYNYVTKGYQDDVSKGQDLKKGYSIVNYISDSQGERKVEFKGFIKEGSKKPCAIMMIYTRTGKPPEYLCIPSSDAGGDLWQMFWKSLVKDPTANNQDKLWLYSNALAKLSTYFVGK